MVRQESLDQIILAVEKTKKKEIPLIENNSDVAFSEDLDDSSVVEETLAAERDEDISIVKDTSDAVLSEDLDDFPLDPSLVYGSQTIDYLELFYGSEDSPVVKEEEVYVTELVPKRKVEVTNEEEAEITLKDIQYSLVLGSFTELNHQRRESFATWATFNPSLMGLFHSLYAVTSDVDYSKTI